MNKPKAIDVKNLTKSFGEKHVLQGMNLHVDEGQTLVVLGRSGVGKSVLIKCMVRLLEPDDGSIHVMEKDVTTIEHGEPLDDFRRKVGFLFQAGALYDSMSVEDNLRFPLDRLPERLDEEEIQERIDEVLTGVGLSDARKKMPAELSGGMKKRIALARSLIMKPSIMLYDEPTTGLDPITSYEISELIEEMQARYKMTSLIITHDMQCAEITADHIVMMRDGQVAVEGSYQELQQNDDPWIKGFFTGKMK
jgi:phospholipid/cholesterol/gamma-HCH transport system ATP-binding protein